MENIQINSLADLDRLVAQQFNLPLHPYSTDIKAALDLVVWNLENSDSEWPYFSFERSPYGEPDEPFIASFERDAWSSGATAPLSICKSALRYIKKIAVTIGDRE